MFKRTLLPLTALLMLMACAKRVPPPAGLPPGTPHVSWILMHGDRDTPDREFACQSEPRSECVLPASRPGAEVFADVHLYYHGTGPETKYVGSFRVGFFEESRPFYEVKTNATVKKNEKIIGQSVYSAVKSVPGNYMLSIAMTATAGSGPNLPIGEEVPVVIR